MEFSSSLGLARVSFTPSTLLVVDDAQDDVLMKSSQNSLLILPELLGLPRAPPPPLPPGFLPLGRPLLLWGARV
jgi:hypothetical protein